MKMLMVWKGGSELHQKRSRNSYAGVRGIHVGKERASREPWQIGTAFCLSEFREGRWRLDVRWFRRRLDALLKLRHGVC